MNPIDVIGGSEMWSFTFGLIIRVRERLNYGSYTYRLEAWCFGENKLPPADH